MSSKVRHEEASTEEALTETDTVRCVIPESATRTLEEAKVAGHAARMRISGTAGGIGGALFTFFVVSMLVFPVASDLGYLGIICWPCGGAGMLLSLLPTDRKLVFWVSRFIRVLVAACVYQAVSLSMLHTPGLGRAGDACIDDTPGWLCVVDAACLWAVSAITVGICVELNSSTTLDFEVFRTVSAMVVV